MVSPNETGERGGRLSADDAARFSEQLAGLTSAGLPLGPGLRAAALEMGPGRLRSSLAAMARAVEAGASVEEAVEAQGGRLPAHLKGLVRIGSRTGRTGPVLGRFVASVNVGVDLRRRL